MRCDIIIPVWNQPAHTRTCIENLARNTRYPYRLILVDNGSEAETGDYIKALAIDGVEKLVIRNELNLGFVKAVNQGLKCSNAPYVCVLNNDTIPAPGWLERLVEFAESHEDVGLMNPVCGGHGDIPVEEYARKLEANKGRYMEMNQCFGFCMLIRRELIDKIGYLDEAFGIGGFDDTDYSMRAHKAGYRSVCVHSSYVYHKQHASFNAMGDRRALVAPGEQAYFRKWPRHLRVGVSFYADGSGDREIENLLKDMLFLAREWCWVNLWIFGDKAGSRARIEAASRKIEMPLHQNIKFNYFPKRFGDAQSAIRLIERSFGTKSRKRYDVVLAGNDRTLSVLNALYPLHRTRIRRIGFEHDAVKELASMISGLRDQKHER